MNYRIEDRDGSITVDGQPLIFYHFQGLKILTRRLFDTGFLYHARMPTTLRRLIYFRYMEELFDTERWARARVPSLTVLSPRLRSRNYTWLTVLWRLIQGQVMLIPHQ